MRDLLLFCSRACDLSKQAQLGLAVDLHQAGVWHVDGDPNLDPIQHPEKDPKRTRNRPETEPKRSQTEPKRSQTEPKWTEIKAFGVGRAGGLSG